VGLKTGDLDAVDGAGGGVAGNLLWRDAQIGVHLLGVHAGPVGLRVSGPEKAALNDLVTAKTGAVFDAVLDQVSLFGQGCDLGQQSAEGVNVVGDGGSHFAVFLVLPCRYCLVSDGSVSPNYTTQNLF